MKDRYSQMEVIIVKNGWKNTNTERQNYSKYLVQSRKIENLNHASGRDQ